MRYRIGDELILKIEETHIGYSQRTFRKLKVQVIGYNIDGDGDDAEYMVYVPHYEMLSSSWVLTERHATWYGVDKKFVGDNVAFIAARHPVYKHMPAPQGECCDRCQDFHEGAVRDDNGDYMCRACKLNPYR